MKNIKHDRPVYLFPGQISDTSSGQHYGNKGISFTEDTCLIPSCHAALIVTSDQPLPSV